MVVNYKLGKIYKLCSNKTDKIYIGSTAQKYLSTRLARHKQYIKEWMNGKHNYVTSFEMFKFDDVKIILIESYPCDNKDQLHAREQYWIDQNKDICINHQKAFTGISSRLSYAEYIYKKSEKYKIHCIYCDCTTDVDNKAKHEN